MDGPEQGFWNSHLVMGIFALYVVIVSLLRIMADKEFFRLSAMKKVWGRSRGLAMHFISNVGVPLVCGIMFLSSGIAGFGVDPPSDRRAPGFNPILKYESTAVGNPGAPARSPDFDFFRIIIP